MRTQSLKHHVRGRERLVGGRPLEIPRPRSPEPTAIAAFERGLLVETAGPRGEAVKLLPPLTITEAELDQGLELLADAVRSVC